MSDQRPAKVRLVASAADQQQPVTAQGGEGGEPDTAAVAAKTENSAAGMSVIAMALCLVGGAAAGAGIVMMAPQLGLLP